MKFANLRNALAASALFATAFATVHTCKAQGPGPQILPPADPPAVQAVLKAKAPEAVLLNSVFTVSPKGYAQVDATYRFSLNKGLNTIVLDRLPKEVVTSSINADQFTGKITLGPVSYRAANLSPGAIEARLLNKDITLLLSGSGEDQKKQIAGTLLSFDGSTAVLKLENGVVQKVPNVQGWQSAALPDGVNNTPSLTISLEADRAGTYDGNIRFRTRGVGYSTSHMWNFNETDNTLVWSTDVLVKNSSGAQFQDVELNLAAGDTGEDQAVMVGGEEGAPGGVPQFAPLAAAPAMAPARVRNVETEDLSGVQIFTVPTKVTVQQDEEQKIPFFRSTNAVKVRRENRVRATAWYVNGGGKGYEQKSKVNTVLIFRNDADSGLGLAIPRGPVSVQQRNSKGTLMPIGGTRLNDVAIGEEVSSQIGSDWNLKATHKVTDFTTSEPEYITAPKGRPTRTSNGNVLRWYRRVYTWYLSTDLHNGKNQAMDITVEAFANDEYRLIGRHSFEKVREGLWETTVNVQPNADATIKYTVQRVEISYEEITPEPTPPTIAPGRPRPQAQSPQP